MAMAQTPFSGVLVFAISFRHAGQTAVGDTEFLRSMIPHHSGAILMRQQASLTDREVLGLCAEIVSSQEREIARMTVLLARR
ncbi:MAG: DUF305 domain-containing protein [Brevundimonas sp.]|nr:DUF305 domain-containing protein [Brevundimonas sp.]